MCLILLQKIFHNPFVILTIHKHCNHQYHADFDICHDLYGLIIEEHEHVPHMPEKFSRTSLVIRHAPPYALA